jgi:hypothetical protein
VFGDSFCCYNENWINIISNRLNTEEVIIKGKGGAGMVHTYSLFHNNVNNFTKDDYIIIGLSNRTRHLFSNDFATSSHILDIPLSKLSTYYSSLKAAKEYFKILEDPYITSLISQCLIGHIINSVIPSLPTQRVAVVRTVMTDNIGTYKEGIPDKYKHIIDKNNSLWSIMSDWVTDKDNIKATEVFGNKKYAGPNHWIDDKEYTEFFFDRIDYIWSMFEEQEGASLSHATKSPRAF